MAQDDTKTLDSSQPRGNQLKTERDTIKLHDDSQ